MDLLKLRLTEGWFLLKTIDEEPDTIVVLGCFNPILRMQQLPTLTPPVKGIYKLQVSKYQYPGVMIVYKCKCSKHPCCWEYPEPLMDSNNYRTLKWCQIERMRVHPSTFTQSCQTCPHFSA